MELKSLCYMEFIAIERFLNKDYDIGQPTKLPVDGIRIEIGK